MKDHQEFPVHYDAARRAEEANPLRDISNPPSSNYIIERREPNQIDPNQLCQIG